MGPRARAVERYLARQAKFVPGEDRHQPPHLDLRAVVVIPAYRERHSLPQTLASLEHASDTPDCFEVIVVVNSSVEAPPEARQDNQSTLDWLAKEEFGFPLHALDRCSEGHTHPTKRAGVGLARREGLDMALRRLSQVGRGADGMLCCLDADSPVAPRYVDGVLDAMPDGAIAGICRCEHRLPDDPEQRRAIQTYEAWLRCRSDGLRQVGSPYFIQPIGSCIVAPGWGYARASGMPIRRDMEDFYFIQNCIKSAGKGEFVQELNDVRVFPSSRPSDRVPRGTGPSVAQILNGQGTFEFGPDPTVFKSLSDFLSSVPAFYDDAVVLPQDEHLEALLQEYRFDDVVVKWREQAPSRAHFVAHFHRWFDGTMTHRFLNRCVASGRRTRIPIP